MDSVPRIRVKKELFNLLLSTEMENKEVDRASNWKKALLVRDLDLVQAGIKIIMAMPTNSKAISNLGKTVHASLKDFEAMLLHNQMPVRRLDSNSSLSLPERHKNAYPDTTSSWRKALLARNLDLVHTCVHAILLNLPRGDIAELVETAFAALKDLQGIILKDNSSPHQIAHFNHDNYKLNDSVSNADSKKAVDDSSQTQTEEKLQNGVISPVLTESENQVESQIPLHHVGDRSYPEEPENAARPARAATPRIQEKPQNIVKPQKKLSSSDEKEPQNHVEIKNPGLNHDVAFPQEKGGSPPTSEKSNSLPSALICSICKYSLTDGRCVSCSNFAMKMENSMKQNVFYECSHVDNLGGVSCKVCRYNLYLMSKPNYANEKKIQVIHKQIGPCSKTYKNQKANVETKQPNTQNGTHGREVIERDRPNQNVGERNSSVNKIPLIAPDNVKDAPILISHVTSLSATCHRVSEGRNGGMAPTSKSAPLTQNKCPVCKSVTSLDGRCRACVAFAQRIDDLMEKNIFYECSHENLSGGSKCRVCRYNQIIQLKKEREQNKGLPRNTY